ncbi:MAG: helix-turn-helix domain-containing protein [Clostridiales bacterium]|nr:helix-turn-helix domain-containing protein [Clostridiales bacterium]
MEVKDRIKARRTELGLTLEQVGNYVGVSKSTVKKWETGYISNMRRDKIARLSEILQISPVELMGWDTGEDMHLTITDGDPQMEALTQTARQLNAQGLQKLVDFADDLVASGKYEKKPLNQELVAEYRKQLRAEESAE